MIFEAADARLRLSSEWNVSASRPVSPPPSPPPPPLPPPLSISSTTYNIGDDALPGWDAGRSDDLIVGGEEEEEEEEEEGVDEDSSSGMDCIQNRYLMRRF